jgi:hypothetical protein
MPSTRSVSFAMTMLSPVIILTARSYKQTVHVSDRQRPISTLLQLQNLGLYRIINLLCL